MTTINRIINLPNCSKAIFPQSFFNPYEAFSESDISEIRITNGNWKSEANKIPLSTEEAVRILFKFYEENYHDLNKNIECKIEGFNTWITEFLPTVYEGWQKDLWNKVLNSEEITILLIKLNPEGSFMNKLLSMLDELKSNES